MNKTNPHLGESILDTCEYVALAMVLETFQQRERENNVRFLKLQKLVRLCTVHKLCSNVK